MRRTKRLLRKTAQVVTLTNSDWIEVTRTCLCHRVFARLVDGKCEVRRESVDA